MRTFVCVIAALLFGALPVRAADLSIALGADVTSIDPHFHNLTPNNNVGNHVFETLVGKDAKGRLVPLLAESWRTVDELTWEFKLRRGVKFHDGSDFTAADVVFSLDRVPTVPNSPSSFATYSKQITEKIVVDPHTLRLKTATPYPLMPNDMGTIMIVSSRAAKGASTEDFNSGKAAVGTGPFKFTRWQKGEPHRSRALRRLLGPESPVGPRHVPHHHVRPDARRVAARERGARDRERAHVGSRQGREERRPVAVSCRVAPGHVPAHRQLRGTSRRS